MVNSDDDDADDDDDDDDNDNDDDDDDDGESSPDPPPAGSLLALGSLLGSLSAVFLMDAVGRKASLLAFSVMSLFIGWTMMMAASQAWQLYVGRSSGWSCGQ